MGRLDRDFVRWLSNYIKFFLFERFRSDTLVVTYRASFLHSCESTSLDRCLLLGRLPCPAEWCHLAVPAEETFFSSCTPRRQKTRQTASQFQLTTIYTSGAKQQLLKVSPEDLQRLSPLRNKFREKIWQILLNWQTSKRATQLSKRTNNHVPHFVFPVSLQTSLRIVQRWHHPPPKSSPLWCSFTWGSCIE